MICSPLIPLPHGFSTRQGGVSEGPYAGLNLSTSTGDDPQKVAENQRRLLERFGHPPIAYLHQVHGNVVHRVDQPGEYKGDGLLTQTPGLLLRVGVADCYPVLLHDPVKQVAGALHAGWRGTVSGILPVALESMEKVFRSQRESIRVALGPGAGPGYQVGPEVVAEFEQAGLPTFHPDPGAEGKFCLDLAAALHQQAKQGGIKPEHFWACGLDTLTDPTLYSHRRDKGLTGRMWGAIKMLIADS